ncbi:MAG TPA: hypothetical protein VLL25_13500 [Acidimicrobiales bacterium]|nr:hypothetical protein [Acidimicrobiales bacterium]
MTAAVAHAIQVLAERAGDDEALAEAVVFLAEDNGGPEDPFANPGRGVLSAARVVNEHRQRVRRSESFRRALDTAQVVELIGSISDRKGVDRRRRRGQLLGWRSGARTLHPAWQFDRRRGETRSGLGLVLAALAEVCDDPQVADALMSTPRDDLDGLTLADLLAAGRVETVVRLILAAGDQS